MKKLILTLTAATMCVGAFGQGKLQFQVNSTGLIYFTTDKSKMVSQDTSAVAQGSSIVGASAYTGTGSSIASLSGTPSFIAALYGGTSAGSLSLQTTTTIANYNLAGQLTSVPSSFASIPAGAAAYFQIEIYDSRYADATTAWAHQNAYAGESLIFTAVPSASSYPNLYVSTSPTLSNLGTGTQVVTGFTGAKGLIALYAQVPEPGTFALAGLGMATLMIFRRRK